MRRLLYLISLTCLTVLPGWAQDSTDIEPPGAKDVVISPEDDDEADSTGNTYHQELKVRRDTVSYAAANDRTPVQVRSVDGKLLNEIRSSRDYQYGTDVPPTASLWDRFKAWLWTKLGELLASKGYRNVGQYILLAAVAALVVWLLYRAQVLNRLFARRAKDLGLDYTTLDEDIHAINFADRIEEAVSQRNYRLAVRLLYLQTLKRLTDGGLIRWQPNKTNRQYAYELTGNPARLGFEQLTTQFEYIWYGDFPVDETRFHTIRQAFTQFNAA